MEIDGERTAVHTCCRMWNVLITLIECSKLAKLIVCECVNILLLYNVYSVLNTQDPTRGHIITVCTYDDSTHFSILHNYGIPLHDMCAENNLILNPLIHCLQTFDFRLVFFLICIGKIAFFTLTISIKITCLFTL